MATAKRAFPRLFELGMIGQMEIRNRIVMPPIVTNTGTREGFVTQRTRDHYEVRAKGGVGLIIVEATHIDFPRGRGFIYQLAIDDDKDMPGLRRLAESIKRHGARAAIQIVHSGAATKSSLTGVQPVAPSPISVKGFEMPRVLTTSDIGDLVRQFGEAAGRAQRAGFEGVEIHAAHYFLIARFLSPACNQRQDSYGGNTEKRARFLQETIQAMKSAVGRNYPVWCRINGQEYGVEDALSHEEAKRIACLAEEAGADAIHVSSWDHVNISYEMMGKRVSPAEVPLGFMAHLAEGIKKVVKVPVIAVGRITPEVGEELLREGKADLIAIGRGLIADPELPNKAAQSFLTKLN